MPIPTSRGELVELVTSSFSKLMRELDDAGSEVGDLACVDDWTVKDLLAVRAWWTESVADWIASGRKGEHPSTPAVGYSWKETPRLNADIVAAAQDDSLACIRRRLENGYRRVLATIDALDDQELLQPGRYAWAGKWPISRWISINTARQYTTARTFLRRALREA